jgi:CheY-like chemotaxis protein
MTPKTVVVVDDDPDMRLLVRLVIEARGDCRVVAELVDGPEAIDELEQMRPPPVPDVLVLDNHMQVMTGLEVAERVLADHPGLPIILFSAFLSSDVQTRAEELGISACLAKGDYDQLPSLINRLTAA